MRKTAESTIEALREHARLNPEDSYAQIADTFGLSVISVKRHCADLGRGKHWRRGKKKETADHSKFWAAVDRGAPSDCWLWKGCLNSSGYGFVHIDGRSQGAHRVAYELMHGAIPEGAELDHLCRNRPCCNPAHLEPISHGENMRRVRLAQDKSREGVQHTLANLIEPGPDIDTAQNIHTAPGFDVVPHIINVSSLKAGIEGQAPGSVSMGLVHKGFVDPYKTEFELERSRRCAQALRDEHWGPSGNRRRRSSGGDDFRYFMVGVGGYGVRMIARTAADAEAMFQDIWGPCHDIQSQEDGRPDPAIIEEWFGRWRCAIGNKYKIWMESELSKAWRERQEERKKRERQARDEREEDAKVDAEFEYHSWKQDRRVSTNVRRSHARY